MREGSSWSMVSVRGVVCILVISEKLVKGRGGLCLKDSCTYQLGTLSSAVPGTFRRPVDACCVQYK